MNANTLNLYFNMELITINIKPLSVNEVWQGKRFKTPAYKAYEKHLLLLLPNSLVIPKDVDLKIELQFGLSNIVADFDNPVKPFIDVLQKKYGFNDRYIQEATIKKFKTFKGMEWIRFNITEL